jgi:hypothetical protein
MNKNIKKTEWIDEETIQKIRTKRGRKNKKELEILEKYAQQLKDLGIEPEVKKNKKRGRKPKGGKIITNEDKLNQDIEFQPNVILHLKCNSNVLNQESLVDMNYNPKIENIAAFNEVNDNLTESSKFFNIEVSNDFIKTNNITNVDVSTNHGNEEVKPNDFNKDNLDMKLIWSKLKELQYNLHNNIVDTDSHCFRCTCKFEGQPCHIPKGMINGKIEVYGIFCMPECAVGHLFDEPIDTSTKWERYALLNNIYKPVYNYSQNIKPSPSPYYILNKFLGNLSIQEYRELSRKDTNLLVVDKPLTRVLPELHDENITYPKIHYGTKSATSGNSQYRLKRNKPLQNKKNQWVF